MNNHMVEITLEGIVRHTFDLIWPRDESDPERIADDIAADAVVVFSNEIARFAENDPPRLVNVMILDRSGVIVGHGMRFTSSTYCSSDESTITHAHRNLLEVGYNHRPVVHTTNSNGS